MRTRVDVPLDFEAQVAAEPSVAPVLDDGASEVAATIRSVAPRRTGAYIASVEVVGVRRDGSKFVGVVEVNDPAWNIIEWGSEDTPAHAPIRKALHRLGLKSDI